MSFRSKLFLVFLVTVLASVSVVAYSVTHYTRAAFEEMDAQRTEALVAQFNKEFEQSGEGMVQQVENVANSEITLRAAMDLARPNADQSLYVHDAIGVSQDHGLDFVEFVNWDGTIISSSQNPGRVGYKNDWVAATKDWRGTSAFLKKEELPDSVALSVAAVRTVGGGNDKNLYIIGGRSLDQRFSRLAGSPFRDARAPVSQSRSWLSFLCADGCEWQSRRSRAISAVDRTVAEKAAELGADHQLDAKRGPLPRHSMPCLYWGAIRNCWVCCWWAARAKNWCY